MMQFGEDGETLKDKSRCANIRADLKMCLLQSDCCKIYRHTPRECLKLNDGTIPAECIALRNTFFECKHSIKGGQLSIWNLYINTIYPFLFLYRLMVDGDLGAPKDISYQTRTGFRKYKWNTLMRKDN